MCYVIELCCCTVSLCYVAVFVVSVLCTVCHCVLLCQCVMSPSHVRYHYVVVLSHCTMSPFFNAVSLFFNVLCTVSLYYVSETGYHYVVLCRAFSVSVLCTVCQCTMSARLDIIMSYYVALVQSVCYAPYVNVLCQRDWISLCHTMSRLFSQYAMHCMSVYYVSETGYHYVLGLCHCFSGTMLFTLCCSGSSSSSDILLKQIVIISASSFCRQSTLPAALIEFHRPLLLNIVPNSCGRLFLAVHMIEQYH